MDEWHAFYSKQQEDITRSIELFNKANTGIKTITNLYKLKDSDKLVEITIVFRTSDYPNYKSCPINFNDAKYLGVVSEWVRVGKYI